MSAESKHVEALRRGPRSWNAWRSQNPSINPNLTGVALSVGERQMGPISGGPINLASARLRHASLRFATLTGADLTMADLWDADLSDARLDGANLSSADLTEALLDRADFAGAKLANANFSSASLQEALDDALGDAFTLLPPHLARPPAWSGIVAPVINDYPVRAESYAPEASVTMAPTRVETVSWLVGGPRSNRPPAHSVTPPRPGRDL